MSGDGFLISNVFTSRKTVCLTHFTATSVPISSSYEIFQYLHNGGLFFKKCNISGNKPEATEGFAVIPNNNTVCP